VAASFWSHRGVGALGWKLWACRGSPFFAWSPGQAPGMVLVEQCHPARRTQAGYNQPVRHLVGTAVQRSIAGVAVFEGEGNPLRLRCSLVPHDLGERGKRCRVRKMRLCRWRGPATTILPAVSVRRSPTRLLGVVTWSLQSNGGLVIEAGVEFFGGIGIDLDVRTWGNTLGAPSGPNTGRRHRSCTARSSGRRSEDASGPPSCRLETSERYETAARYISGSG
jgi:hypothetical protein